MNIDDRNLDVNYLETRASDRICSSESEILSLYPLSAEL